MEDEANRNLMLSINISILKNQFIENFNELAQVGLQPQDSGKMPLDLFYDIIEADFIYKME